MKLKSEDFEENSFIPSRFTCDGEDVSPRLYWEDVPEDAKSLALSMTDPDAPSGTFIHWLVYNMPQGIRRVERGGLPAGATQVRNDFGRERYGDPCPPSGTHRYYFKLYALDTDRLEEKITRRNFFEVVQKHMIGSAELMGRYRRK
jgi:Raf kinase inhibitor-like YbhB/YbcL family protein